MTLFIDLRATPSGGVCARDATLWEDGTRPVSASEFASRIGGRDVILATHGFNVSRKDGLGSLSTWSQLCRFPPAAVFVGVLWPGDSRYFPVVDYPFEGDEAIASGRLLAWFLNEHAGDAASLSFISHSLGARMVLEALGGINRDVRCLILMAGAIENDCLVKEYQQSAAKAKRVCVLSSKADRVLELAFPAGNLVGEIIMRGHPYFRTALGRSGPAGALPGEGGGVWQIPKGWDFGHGDYLGGDPLGQAISPPVDPPGESTPAPSGAPRWKPSWSAGVASTPFR
jgi:hypothetical protein